MVKRKQKRNHLFGRGGFIYDRKTGKYKGSISRSNPAGEALLEYRSGSFKVPASKAVSEARYWADYYGSPVTIYRITASGARKRGRTVKPKVRKNPGWIRAKAVKVIRNKRGQAVKLRIRT